MNLVNLMTEGRLYPPFTSRSDHRMGRVKNVISRLSLPETHCQLADITAGQRLLLRR